MDATGSDDRPRDTTSAETPAAAAAAPSAPGETRHERRGRHARRARLYTIAIVFIVLLVVLVALAAANDRTVKLDWIVGSTHASLVWIILAATVLGWLLGVVMSALFRFRTRRPR